MEVRIGISGDIPDTIRQQSSHDQGDGLPAEYRKPNSGGSPADSPGLRREDDHAPSFRAGPMTAQPPSGVGISIGDSGVSFEFPLQLGGRYELNFPLLVREQVLAVGD